MFLKNDNSFICENCGSQVEKLGYTSRDHCNRCLYSLHVDIEPGDRLNTCRGLLKPINVLDTGKKHMQIEYVCTKCGKKVRNVIAEDDSKQEILKVVENYARTGGR